jgi:succinate dehydrogenase / fumarate reductase cytochrome b subunit
LRRTNGAVGTGSSIMAEATTKRKRPVYLDLIRLSLALPLPGIVSILHRISGALLFLFLFLLLSLLQDSLSSPQTFAALKQTAGNPVVKFILLGLLWAYLHHLCAGVRYLFLDIDKGVALPVARASSWAVLGVSIALTVALGARILW